MDQDVAIQVKKVRKVFKVGSQDVEVLKSIEFNIYKNDFIIIFGPSGCGKSTLLHTILGLERPTEGSVEFFGQDLYYGRNEDEVSAYRKRTIGMVYQQANWIKALTVIENVAFPLTLSGFPKHKARSKALSVLKEVGMDRWADYMPTELSSGQQQKISLARSLVNEPRVIVADEPTGNLDYNSGQDLMELLVKMNRILGKMVIMVTHDLEYLKYATRIAKIFDGKLVGIYTGDQKEEILAGLKFKRGVNENNGDEKSTERQEEGANEIKQ